ncbi:unnamed protein product [Symbiodinium sp. CCMP2456]|nr:unnamed protein product [Symbiodinium sp. CCMP2456]
MIEVLLFAGTDEPEVLPQGSFVVHVRLCTFGGLGMGALGWPWLVVFEFEVFVCARGGALRRALFPRFGFADGSGANVAANSFAPASTSLVVAGGGVAGVDDQGAGGVLATICTGGDGARGPLPRAALADGSGAGVAAAAGTVDGVGGGPTACNDAGAGGVLADLDGVDSANYAARLGAGGALADCGGGDPLRGGAGGAAATRRKRTEKLLQGLHGLLEDWGGEAENDQGAEDGSEELFMQLEQLLWARPADPFRALQRLLQQWSSERGADGGWQTVSRRKAKDKKKAATTPSRVVQLSAAPLAAKGREQAHGKGAGKGKGRAADKDKGPGYTGSMCVDDWCPRAADWDHGAVVVSTIDEVWGDPTLDYIVYLKSAGEMERFRTLVQSSENAPDITFVVLKGDGALEARRREFAEVEWVEAPSLKASAFNPKESGAHFRAWAADSFGSIKDTWQWQLTRGPGGAEATVEGLIRVPSSRVAAALSASGSRHGGETWFVSNVSRAQELQGVPALTVHWQEWEPSEAWGTYLARCRRASQAVDFGLARGGQTAWHQDVSEFLVECRFEEPSVEERLPWKGATAWTFRATMPADTDFISIDLDGDTIEFSRLGRDNHHARDRALRPRRPKETMHVDGGGDRPRLDDGKSLPGQGSDDAAAKRPKTGGATAGSGPQIPAGMKLIDNAGQGSTRPLTPRAPNAEQSDIKSQGFAEYLRLFGRDQAWGGSIELAALASTLNQPIFVVRPLGGEFDIRVFGPANSKATPLTLWFQRRHYQALVGEADEVAARAVKAEVGDPADRGGGKDSVRGRASIGSFDVGEMHGSCAFGASVWALRQKRYRENPLAAGGRIPTFECPHCDYAYSHASRDIVCKARRQHLNRWHDGAGLPGPIRVVTSAFRQLSADEVRADAFDWKCPVCRFGLPSGLQQTLTRHVVDREKAAHRRKKHPSFDTKQWQALAAAQAQRRRCARRIRVVQAANKRAAKRVRGTSCHEYDGYQTLLWPMITTDHARPRPTRVVWKHAWSCSSCNHLFTSREDASMKAHRCCRYSPKKGLHKIRRGRFFKAVRFLRKSPHGLPEEVLTGRLAEAEAALQRSDPACRRLTQKP